VRFETTVSHDSQTRQAAVRARRQLPRRVCDASTRQNRVGAETAGRGARSAAATARVCAAKPHACVDPSTGMLRPGGRDAAGSPSSLDRGLRSRGARVAVRHATRARQICVSCRAARPSAPEQPSRVPPRDALTQRARTSLARRAHKACADSEAIHFCDRPGSAILDWSGHAIGPKGVRRLGDHSPV
jgi:hypothetical protein